MDHQLPLRSGLVLWCVSVCLHAQSAAGIIAPSRLIDWSASGVPGGIPARTTICSTTACSNLASLATGTAASSANTTKINAALSSAPANSAVLIPPGTWSVTNIIVPNNVTLRGPGTQTTMLDGRGTGGNLIQLGSGSSSGDIPNAGSSVSISSGATAGSTSIVTSSASGIAVGSYLLVTELNDSSFVTTSTTNGTCTWCDNGMWGGNRVRGQIEEVTSVAGTTIGIMPPLYTAYSHTPLATPVAMGGKYVGVENLQLFDNNTGYTANIEITRCAYCWVRGIESNYSDGDHVQAYFSYRGEIRDSYFTSSFNHHSGGTDASVNIAGKSTAFLVENNILERLHVSLMSEWGNAGTVFGYNFDTGNYDDTGDPSINHVQMMAINMHGSHPQFNLWEGNVTQKFDADGFWGSSSHSTAFRNWSKGTTLIAPYVDGSYTGRKIINWNSAFVPNQSNLGFNLAYVHTNYSFVGNVTGSSEVASVDALYHSGPTACTSCAISPAVRQYQGTFYPFSFGYGTTSDSTGQCSLPNSSCVSYSSTFLHGNYDTATNTTYWDVNGTGNHALPPSFYKSSKPAWWGTLAWPAIGPDVTTGDGPGGHAYLSQSNPAQACYKQTAKNAAGLLQFDPNACYGTSGPGQAPAPPTGLTAVVQ